MPEGLGSRQFLGISIYSVITKLCFVKRYILISFFLFTQKKCPKNAFWEFPNLGLSRIDTAALFEMTFYQIAFYCHSPWLVCSTFKGFLCFVYCVAFFIKQILLAVFLQQSFAFPKGG